MLLEEKALRPAVWFEGKRKLRSPGWEQTEDPKGLADDVWGASL